METDRPIWRPRAWMMAAVVLLAVWSVFAVAGFEDPVPARIALTIVLGTAVLVVGWAAMRTRSQRRHYEAELAAWSAERAAQAERLRIARDLHDLASHGLGLITLRAAAARRATGADAEAERQNALADIERAGRQATTELRRMLAVLRAPEPAPLRPSETLNDLPAIVQAATRAGLRVGLEVADVGDASAGAQLATCAVVREGLNNALRHAGPTHVEIGVRRERETLVVEVRDAGRQPGWQAHPGAGHGLDGLRERIAALDGELQAGMVDGGWLLTARIPDRSAP